MPTWDAVTWATVVATAVAVCGVAVAVLAWLRPRHPRAEAFVMPHETLQVKVSNHFPVLDNYDGSRQIGDHLVGVTVSNGTSRAVKATNWGVHLPGSRNLVVMARTTSWEPPLPHWIQPGMKRRGT